MAKLTIEDLDFKGKRVFMRVDYNVPLTGDGKVADDQRIVASLPSVKHVLEHGGKLILASHLGRPKGKVKEELRVAPVAKRLGELLQRDIKHVTDCIGTEVEAAAASLEAGDILLLENLRFHAEEEKNDPGFAKNLASLADVYVNDAFGTMHRAHASTEGITKHVDKCAAGLLVMKELQYFDKALKAPERPMAAILGGAKVSSKIGVINNLMDKVDVLFIGGGMAYTFEKAKGMEIGDSLLEEDKLDLANQLMRTAEEKGIKLILPLDHLAADGFSEDAKTKTVEAGGIEPGWEGVDIGPKTIDLFKKELAGVKTILWNGPLGAFEVSKFANGTFEIARAIAEMDVTCVIGGGDSASAIKRAGVADRMSHISTGGGASLELIEGKTLPGVAALTDK